MPTASEAARYRTVRKVTLIGSAVDLSLGAIKLAVGWLAHSQALIADGVHSLSDLSTDVLVLYAAKHAHSEADEDHPYGHGRIETAATVGLGIALLAVAVGITFDAVHRLFNPQRLLQPEVWALIAAAVSVLCKEAVYRYTIRHARRLRSNLLKANAWHSRSDALSSIAVVIGVAGSMAGLTYIDAIAAVVVAAMIAKIGWEFGWSSVRELVDTGLDSDELGVIRRMIASVDGVAALHGLRTRQMGGKTLVDVHIILDNPRLSVSEGHQLSETVRAKLFEHGDDIMDVMVHIDPEDDEHTARNPDLPSRSELLARLEPRWSKLADAARIDEVTLHYLDGKICIDVLLPVELAQNEACLAARSKAFSQVIEAETDVDSVRLLYY